MDNGRSAADLSYEIDLIIERLEEEFGGVSASVVADVVHHCAAHFDGAPIQTFVPLLVEKSARATLRANGSRASGSYVVVGA